MNKDEIVQAFWEVRNTFPFPSYTVDRRKYVAIVSQIMKECSSGSKILSIGSGPCELEAILAKLGYDVTAIDDLKDQWHLMGQNRERIKGFAEQMNVKLIIQSAELTQLKENDFDVVLLIDIVEHLRRSPRELLNHAISYLKAGGTLLIQTPNSVSLVKRLRVLMGKPHQTNADFFYWNIGEYRGHVREYSRSELEQILSYENLTEINSKMTNFVTGLFERKIFLTAIVVKTYELISGIYPSLRLTILVWGKKPKHWQPTENSVETFNKYYPFMEKYNLDNESDDILIKKILSN